MADTCIVCLGDLVGAESQTLKGENEDKRQNNSTTRDLSNINEEETLPFRIETSEAIAHLLPCGHNLHNECLKPWVERANSCPICRQSFNTVLLKAYVHGTYDGKPRLIQGPCLDSYPVQDKRQTAEVDAGLIVEDDILEDATVEPCVICERGEDEEVLLLCDGCNGSCHTYCAGLDTVPAGSWYCDFCREDGTARTERSHARQSRTARGARNGNRHLPDAWARVWQSVWDNLNIDLDFPFDEDTHIQSSTQRQDIQEWQRRFRIAESQGGAARFRDTAASLLDRHQPRQRADPESQEELRAWNAFDKARELGGVSSRRKRKSPTASPMEPPPAPERVLKRPRTRYKTIDAVETSNTAPQRHAVGADHSDGPSFFNNLLKEVETSPTDQNVWPSSTDEACNAEQSPHGPCTTSPLLPISRSRSNSPVQRSPRPHSTPLASRVEPCPSSGPSMSNQPRQRASEIQQSVRTAKNEIQSIVSAALKPAYVGNRIDREEFTNINRTICRRLYDMVDDMSAHETREKLKLEATLQVELAVAGKSGS